MRRKQDVSELIRQAARTPAEQEALDRTAALLEDSLGADPPARPEFRAELRARLVAQARRQLDTAAAGGPVAVPGAGAWQPTVVPGRRTAPGRRGAAAGQQAATRSRPWLRLSAWGLGTAAAAALGFVVVWNIWPGGGTPPVTPDEPPPAGIAAAPDHVGASPSPEPQPAQPGQEVDPGPQAGAGITSADPGPVEPVIVSKDNTWSTCPWCFAGAQARASSGHELPPPMIAPPDGGLAAPAAALDSDQVTPATLVIDLPEELPVPDRVRVFQVRLWADAVLPRLAAGLGLPAPQPVAGTGAEAAAGAEAALGADREEVPFAASRDQCRSLELYPAGVVIYRYTCADAEAAEPIPQEVAAGQARQFLQLGGTPLPAYGAPAIRFGGEGQWDNVYLATWQAGDLDGYPVLGPVAAVVLSPGGQVLYARLQPVTFEALESARVRTPEEAARELDGISLPGQAAYRLTITGAELVYGYPPGPLANDADRTAQPFWRLTGATDENYQFVGYAPALYGAHLQDPAVEPVD